ncbi:uncharacterized protein LOC113204121 [Frankliniella occidentalis]|uniref:Uncharacterized protein LOC113204121 n=1 Tax=Frankliniella occidentalis TaxID=133901 RepID=A0A6J1S1M2_FRAOC|nr:uncharacterized protein LOC113204121 [Frankliniella occidentalis]XP_026274928.1 uncharacterized protein LOC113204121 [Frankliniella occidentalis]
MKRSASGSASGGGDPQPSSKSARPRGATEVRSLWCAGCWAHPADGCTGEDHRVIPVSEAQLEATTALDDTHRAFKEALKLHQTRLDTVLEATDSMKLMALVDSYLDDDNLCDLDGGWVTIRLAPIAGGLTEEEKESVTEAMTGGELECEWFNRGPEDGAVAAQGSFDTSCMSGVLQKLPRCVEGQTLHAGSIVCFSEASYENFCVYDKAVIMSEDHVRRGPRLFGLVTDGGDAFRATARLDSDDSHYNGIHSTYGSPVHSEFKQVKFVDL